MIYEIYLVIMVNDFKDKVIRVVSPSQVKFLAEYMYIQ